MKKEGLMAFLTLCAISFLTARVYAPPAIFKPGAQSQGLGMGWDVYSGMPPDPLVMGKVIYNYPEGKNNLVVTVILSGAAPNKQYRFGVDIFDWTYSYRIGEYLMYYLY